VPKLVPEGIKQQELGPSSLSQTERHFRMSCITRCCHSGSSQPP